MKEINDLNTNFIPREFPKKEISKPEKKIDKVKERKITLTLLVGSLIIGIVLWFLGNKSLPLQEKSDKIIVIPSLMVTPTPTVSINSSQIIKEFENLTKDLKGSYGLYVYNLTSKKFYGKNENQIFSSASLNKLPLIVTAYLEAEAGRLDLETKYILKAGDKRTGAGSMQYRPVGTIYTYRKLIELMGQQSDNTAFYVLRMVLGDEKIQKTINELGLKNTVFDKFDSSPADIGLLLRKLYGGSIISREHRDEIIKYLTSTFDESRIPAGVPEEIKVAHKVGTDIGVISDGGIVFAKKPYIVVIMSQDVLIAQAQEVLPKISQLVWEYENK